MMRRLAQGALPARGLVSGDMEWQRRERALSTRPWDDDYEEVKAAFPDLFDAEGDRQRSLYLAMRSAVATRKDDAA